MKNELGLEEGSIYVKRENPAPTWLSDAVFGWGKEDWFRLEKRSKTEWKIKGLKMKVNRYLPTIFSCQHL